MQLRKHLYILAAIVASAGLASADEWKWHHGPPQFPDRPERPDFLEWPEDNEDWDLPEWPEDGDEWDFPMRPDQPEDGDEDNKPERPDLPGGDKVFGNGNLPEFLAKFDLDDNGLLDEEERQAARADRRDRARERREEWDVDGDGEISTEEREEAREALRAKIEEHHRERFLEVDNGEDGALNLDEFAGIGALERLADRRPQALQRIFNRLDQDDNGNISVDEFIEHLRHRRHHCQHHPERPERPDNGDQGDRPERPNIPNLIR